MNSYQMVLHRPVENAGLFRHYRSSMLLECKRRHVGIGIAIEIFDETVTRIVLKLLNRMRL